MKKKSYLPLKITKKHLLGPLLVSKTVFIKDEIRAVVHVHCSTAHYVSSCLVLSLGSTCLAGTVKEHSPDIT